MSANKVIFDSNDYVNEQDGEFIEEDLAYLLSEHTVKTRGKVVDYMFLTERHSHYGSIAGNGQTGYMKANQDSLAKAILSVSGIDSFRVFAEEGLLKVNYYDHDGSHECEIKPITKSRENSIENNLGYFDKMIKYLERMPSVRVK